MRDGIRGGGRFALTLGLMGLMALAPMAAAETAYGTAEGCGRLAGATVGDSVVIWYPRSRLEFHEAVCPITSRQETASGQILLTATCSGEGETWVSRYTVSATPNPGVVALTSTGGSTSVVYLRACS